MIVRTESGTTYDLTDGLLTRLEAPSALRRDGEPVQVVAYAQPVVGEPWHLILDLREDGVLTSRLTSPVVEIERA